MAWPKINLFGSDAPKRVFDKVTVGAIFAKHEADELRGLGSLSALELLINDIVAEHNLVVAQLTGIAPKKPEPAFKESNVSLVSSTAVASAKVAKAAGM